MAYDVKKTVTENRDMLDKFMGWNPVYKYITRPAVNKLYGLEDSKNNKNNKSLCLNCDDPILNNYSKDSKNYSTLEDVLKSSGGSSGSGLAGAADALVAEARKPVDLTGVKNAYKSLDDVYRQIASSGEESARGLYDLTKSNLESARNITRSDLLKSIERFREENNRNREAQRRDYLLGQAELEDARMEANRQSRISAASRGLSGSGLQQLAQLQNLLGQSQDISNLITANQDEMDNLKRALSQKEEDYNTGLTRAEEAYNLGIKGAEKTLTDTLANINNTLQGNLASSAKDIANLELNAAYNTKDAVLQAQQNALNLKSSLAGSQRNSAEEASLLRNNIDQIVNEADRSATTAATAAAKATGKKAGSKKYDEAYNTAYNAALGDSITTLNSLLSEYSVYNSKEGQTGLNKLYNLYK